MSRRLITAVSALALAAALAGCGKVGQLERPGPMFGAKHAVEDKKAPLPQDPNRPVDTVDPRDRGNDGVLPPPPLTPPAPTR